MFSFCVMILFVTAHAETNTGNCKDMLQGYLTGQLSTSLGIFQVEALRREFKSFTDVIEKSMESFKQKITTDMERSEGKKSHPSFIIYTRKWNKMIKVEQFFYLIVSLSTRCQFRCKKQKCYLHQMGKKDMSLYRRVSTFR